MNPTKKERAEPIKVSVLWLLKEATYRWDNDYPMLSGIKTKDETITYLEGLLKKGIIYINIGKRDNKTKDETITYLVGIPKKALK